MLLLGCVGRRAKPNPLSSGLNGLWRGGAFASSGFFCLSGGLIYGPVGVVRGSGAALIIWFVVQKGEKGSSSAPGPARSGAFVWCQSQLGQSLRDRSRTAPQWSKSAMNSGVPAGCQGYCLGYCAKPFRLPQPHHFNLTAIK